MTLLPRTSSAILTIIMVFIFPVSALAQTKQSGIVRTEDWSASRVVSTFKYVGGLTSSTFDNGSISSSGFDFAAIFSHACYDPIGTHIKDACQRRFGVYSDLKSALSTQSLRDTLVTEFGSGILSLLSTANTDAAEEVAEVTAAEEAVAITNVYGDRHLRSVQLWAICQERFVSNPNSCFQDNIRLIRQDQVEVSGNVNH